MKILFYGILVLGNENDDIDKDDVDNYDLLYL